MSTFGAFSFQKICSHPGHNPAIKDLLMNDVITEGMEVEDIPTDDAGEEAGTKQQKKWQKKKVLRYDASLLEEEPPPSITTRMKIYFFAFLTVAFCVLMVAFVWWVFGRMVQRQSSKSGTTPSDGPLAPTAAPTQDNQPSFPKVLV